MSRVSKYPKTIGYYVYCHITPDEMFYIGMSKQQPSQRWKPLYYKGTSLQPGIEEFGWNSIRHVVLKDGLTKEQAEVLECLLIDEATRQGFCLNKQRSGGIKRDNRNEYDREYRQTEKYKEYQHEYRKTEKYKERHRVYNRNRYQNDAEYRERQLERKRQNYLKKKLQNEEEKQI